RMYAAATLEHREVIRTTPPRHELVPPLARITEMSVRIDETRHHDAALGIDLDRFRRALEVMPRVATTGRDNDAVARCEPTAVDRADVACRRADARLLFLEWRQCEKTRTSYDEIRLGHELGDHAERGGCRERAPRPRYHGQRPARRWSGPVLRESDTRRAPHEGVTPGSGSRSLGCA